MFFRIKSLCSLAAMMALLTAQLMGISRGFWCECVGAPTRAVSAQCLPVECHPAMAHTACCQDETGAADEKSQPSGTPDCPGHAHKFLTQEADFQAFTPMALPAPLFFVQSYAGLPPVTWLEDMPVECQEIPPVRRDGWRSPPPMAVTVLRTQVLLV
ncbi:MAG: hypothetical protein V4726_14755 [Verrucomicrobiota bacterium]